MEERWAVVGGGMLGLTLALRAAQAGRRVTVLEAAPGLGGLASAWTLGDVVWDRHYHVTLLSDGALRGVLAELGLDDSMEWVETRTGFWDGKRLDSISSSVDYLRLPALSLVDKLRIGATIWRGSRLTDWQTLERTPVEDWLVAHSGRPAFERLWRPLLEAKLGDRWRESSAAFIWATIQRLYAARRTGLSKEMFGYAPGGYAAVLARFAEYLEGIGVEIRTGCRVESIEAADAPERDGTAAGVHSGSRSAAPGGVRVVSAGSEEVYQRCVVTAAPPLAARICSGLTDVERGALASVPYQGIVCASLLLRRPLAGYYLTYLTGERMPFTAIVEMSAMVDPARLGGNHLVYLPRYVGADDPFFRIEDAELRETFLAGLRRVHPEVGTGDVVDFRVSRVPHVFPIPTLGYSASLPPADTSLPGLHLVSSAHILNGTLNVNETVQLAEREAARLLALPAPAPGRPQVTAGAGT